MPFLYLGSFLLFEYPLVKEGTRKKSVLLAALAAVPSGYHVASARLGSAGGEWERVCAGRSPVWRQGKGGGGRRWYWGPGVCCPLSVVKAVPGRRSH